MVPQASVSAASGREGAGGVVVMKKKLKIFIIAGEVSGDVLGAKIMQALGSQFSPPLGGSGDRRAPRGGSVEFAGIGGENMRAAGLKSIFPISDLSVMGFFEVIAHARTLTRRIRETADAIMKFQPDIVLTIDSPSFVKRVIKRVKIKGSRVSPLFGGSGAERAEGGLVSNNYAKSPPQSAVRTAPPKRGGTLLPKFYHVVAPQVWAWGAGRAKKFAKIFDRLYAFFDFEKPYFEKYGLKTIAVGHPIAEIAPPAEGPLLRANRGGWSIKNIALIPGSRMSEVKKLLPLFKQVAEQVPLLWNQSAPQGRGGLANYEIKEEKVSTDYNKAWLNHPAALNSAGTPPQEGNFFIPVVETTREYIENEIKNWKVPVKIVPAVDRYKLFAKTDLAIAASGTVSAELAIMHIPAIIVYKMNPLTEFLARIFVKTKWVSLVNILLKKTVYPELLGRDATPEKIMIEIKKLESPEAREKMISELAEADKLWRRGNSSPAKLIAEDIKCASRNYTNPPDCISQRRA